MELQEKMNTVGYFEIQSSNPEREALFYSSVFGWEITRIDDIPITYYKIETDTLFGGLLERFQNAPPPGYGTNGFVNSIQVTNFDETAQTILKAGGKVALPKFALPNICWHGYFMDPDKNTFGVFEIDSDAK